MANTLTNLIPSLYAGLDIVSRELTGYIPAVYRDASVDRAAKGQSVTYHKAPAGNGSDISPAMTIPEPTDQTVGNDTITISNARAFEFGFVGENRLGLDNNGPGFSAVQADMFAQAVRGLINEVETDLAEAAYVATSRAHGTPGSAVFGTNLDEISQLNKILLDNGAPNSDKQFVCGTTAGAALRTLYSLNDDRDFSNVPFNEQGILIRPSGMAVRETGQSQTHTGGTADGSTTDGASAGYGIGDTSITLAAVSSASGAILAGDIVQFGGDSNKYVVTTGVADVSAGGTLVIQEPGLRKAIAGGSAVTVTIVNDGTSSADTDYDVAGVAFHRNALVLAARAPALPEEGDTAIDSMMMTDPVSGLPLEVRVYSGYRKVRYEVGLAWGVKAVKPEHMALLIS